jgi:hypothetical protein
MPLFKTLTETWVCNYCGRGEAHVLGAGLAAAHFVERLHWERNEAGDVVICDRCTAAGQQLPAT